MTQTQLYKVGEPDRHCPGKRNLSWCNIHAAPSSQAWLCWLQALTSVILKSTSSTMMGLEKELKEAAASLQRSAYLVCVETVPWKQGKVPVEAQAKEPGGQHCCCTGTPALAAASVQKSTMPSLCRDYTLKARGLQDEREGCLSSTVHQCLLHCMAGKSCRWQQQLCRGVLSWSSLGRPVMSAPGEDSSLCARASQQGLPSWSGP